MEEQARQSRVQPLMGMATNWLGRAPISTRRTGSTSESGNREANTVGNQQMNGTATQSGPGFLRNLASGLGGVMNTTAGRAGGYGTLADDIKKF
jgi:hypothetical protein